MVDKQLYLQRYKQMHRLKTGEDLSDDLALEYFEHLIALVHSIYEGIHISRIKTRTVADSK
ncbi:MAG: hypothetical protein JWN18_396 [Parcubacteria group bacterium]|nr:hypothetical protein [Parcubacteria group bacterium]